MILFLDIGRVIERAHTADNKIMQRALKDAEFVKNINFPYPGVLRTVGVSKIPIMSSPSFITTPTAKVLNAPLYRITPEEYAKIFKYYMFIANKIILNGEDQELEPREVIEVRDFKVDSTQLPAYYFYIVPSLKYDPGPILPNYEATKLNTKEEGVHSEDCADILTPS